MKISLLGAELEENLGLRYMASALERKGHAVDIVAFNAKDEIPEAVQRVLDDYSRVPGLCFRRSDGTVQMNPSAGNPENLDDLQFPRRTKYHKYFDKPIASLLTSRGCWRDCAFCSINAWYKKGGGRKFRVRSIENVVAEMKQLYFGAGVRIFNMQDDNFFLPKREEALRRFVALRDGLASEGVTGIAIAVKARPDSIHEDAIRVLDDLGLFRVFLGVENASASGLRNLNRKCSIDQVRNALRILNDFDIHIAYNILMFEPDTTMDDILVNLRFMERNIENPFNFCRAEAYAGTGLERKLLAEGRLLGDYFGLDYRLKDLHCEAARSPPPSPREPAADFLDIQRAELLLEGAPVDAAGKDKEWVPSAEDVVETRAEHVELDASAGRKNFLSCQSPLVE